MSILPWPELMLAASQIGIAPAQFWTLSVMEWRALMGEGEGLDGARLRDLISAFPDDECTSPLPVLHGERGEAKRK